jgi:hypothetical protein
MKASAVNVTAPIVIRRTAHLAVREQRYDAVCRSGASVSRLYDVTMPTLLIPSSFLYPLFVCDFYTSEGWVFFTTVQITTRDANILHLL